MNSTLRCGAIVVLVVLVGACGGSEPSSPTGSSPVQTIPSPTPPSAGRFPPLSGPSRTYVFDRALSSRVSDYTKHSRFILYDNGAFVLQYLSLAGEGYRGGYENRDGVIAFAWEGWSVAGTWEATGTLTGDSLTVRYNEIMYWTDFEDALYVRVP